MTLELRTIGSLFRSTALATVGTLIVAQVAYAAVDPNQPDPAAQTVRLRAPGNPSNYVVKPKIVFPETSQPASSGMLPAQDVRYTPVENIGAASEPVVAEQRATPVENPVAAKAGYVAPPPPMIGQPAALPEPLAAPIPADLTYQPHTLSDDTKRILGKVPSKLDASKPKGGKINVSRISPEIQGLVATETKPQTYDTVGLSIKIQRPGLDTNFELNRAYTALMGGDTTEAVEVYKNIIATEPKNQDALFGLAATYHRLGDLDKARTYYDHLLQVNPNHHEGLNNFLALASEESPQDALAELERLEQRNPEFSPIPAQQAVVLNQLGYGELAREKMLRAIDLSPENLTYKYNLAIMLDGRGDYNDASALYRLLIDAALKGEKIPAPLETLQKRLNFLTAASASGRLAGS